MLRTEKTLVDQYKTDLIKLMIFKDGIQYELEHDFTNEELGPITQAVIFRWMCLKFYVNPNLNPNNNPTKGCT